MIRRFFRTLFLLLSDGGSWCDGANWSPEDAMRLAAFLRTETGAKLAARLRNASLSLNASAVQSGSAHHCGRAFGYMTAIADIQTLSAHGSPEETETSEEGSVTGAASLDHLNP